MKSNVNSRIYAAVPVTITNPTPNKLKITQDGLLEIYPIQFTDTLIPFVINIESLECSAMMYDLTADFFPDQDLNSFCVSVSSDVSPETVIGHKLFCDDGKAYIKGTITIPSSALDDFEEEPIVNPCDDSSPVRTKFRKPIINAFITATASVSTDSGVFSLSGESSKFNIYKKENYFDFRKINEDILLSDFIKKFQTVYWTSESKTDTFWDEYIYKLLGESNPSNYNLATMEQIRNYVRNKYDIDTCDIPSLISMGMQMGENIEVEIKDFPQEIDRIMNLISVPKDKIFGTKASTFTKDILRNYTLEDDINLIGEIIKKSEIIIEEKYIFYHHKSSNQLYLTYLDSNDIGKTYNQALSSEFNAKFDTSDLNEFCLYDTADSNETEIYDNIIDYDNPDNKLFFSDSSDWNNAIKEMLLFQFHKNLE